MPFDREYGRFYGQPPMRAESQPQNSSISIVFCEVPQSLRSGMSARARAAMQFAESSASC
jgi:hypothetical protein